MRCTYSQLKKLKPQATLPRIHLIEPSRKAFLTLDCTVRADATTASAGTRAACCVPLASLPARLCAQDAAKDGWSFTFAAPRVSALTWQPQQLWPEMSTIAPVREIASLGLNGTTKDECESYINAE